MYLSYHSFSKVILHPWSYDGQAEPPKNINQLKAMGNTAADAMHMASDSSPYKVGTPKEIIGYSASGLYLLSLIF